MKASGISNIKYKNMLYIFIHLLYFGKLKPGQRKGYFLMFTLDKKYILNLFQTTNKFIFKGRSWFEPVS